MAIICNQWELPEQMRSKSVFTHLKKDLSHQHATIQPSMQTLSPSQDLDVKAGNQMPPKTLGVKNQVGFKQTLRVFRT